MPKLVLIRHGQTQFNVDKRFTGFTDIPIIASGETDARTNAGKLQALGLKFGIVYTSWLQRAWQTLDIVLPLLGQTDVEIIRHPFLNERHYGDLQGRYHAEIIAEYGADQLQIWRRSYNVRPPGGESLEDVVHRASYYLERVIKPRLAQGEHVLVCAHGNSNRAMVKILENISDTDIVKREIAYDEPLVYEI